MRTRIAAIATVVLALASASEASAADLTGDWQAPFTVGGGNLKVEDVTIRQRGNVFHATKVTGDDYVPAGATNLRGIYTSSRFQAEQLCASRGFALHDWELVAITIIDADHFKVEGGCSGNVVWTRDRKPKTS
jgi:hypothetical protein